MRLGVEAALVDGVLVRGDVEVDEGHIVAIGLAAAAGRGIAVPGFIDLQVNGFGGVDFLDADAGGYGRAGEALLETGVTAYLPTLITTPEEELLAALHAIPVRSEGPRILGVHLEGPFLAPSRLGTHLPAARRDPDPELLRRLLDAGPVALVTDAVAGAGMTDGSYSLGGFAVDVRDGVVSGPEGVLAGSALTMIEAVRNLHSLGVPLPEALAAASAVPARVLGLPTI